MKKKNNACLNDIKVLPQFEDCHESATFKPDGIRALTYKIRWKIGLEMNLIAMCSPEYVANIAMKSLHDILEDSSYTHTMKLSIEVRQCDLSMGGT